MKTLRKILLVDDSRRDVELALAGFSDHRLANAVDVVEDGVQALDYLYCRDRFDGRTDGNPVLVLLDLKMPRVDGLEVLRQMKGDLNLKSIPVMVMTSSHEEEDIVRSQQLGVVAYVLKPVKFKEFVSSMTSLGVFWALTDAPGPGAAPQPALV